MNLTMKVTVLLICMTCMAGTWAADEGFRSAEGGLRIQDLEFGQGQGAAVGQVATIHFIGWIDQQGVRGREIYNSRSRGQQVSFVIGTERVMPGWNAGVLGMKPGGTRMLLVPPGMAYGNRTIDDVVPANAALMFRIELLALDDPPGN